MSDDLNSKVGLDTTDFKKGVSDLTSQIKSIEAGFRASAAVMENWSGTTNGLRERVSSLSDILDKQKSKLSILHSEYTKVVEAEGADSKAAESLASKMFSVEKAISSTESSLSKFSIQLKTVEQQEKSSTGLGKLKIAFAGLAEQSQKSTSSISNHFSNLKSTIVGAVAGIGLSLGATGLVKSVYGAAESASNLSEAQNVVENTFKSSSKAIEDWTSTTAASAGIGKTAATSMVGAMGAMMKSSGITEKSAGDMSKKLVQLTGDMSSFYNVSTSDMWEKLRSGISGETEPLKQLGINMSVANIEAFAMSQGIKKAYKDMSQAEQTTLRYNYLMKVTADAQGDFARTSSTSMANQSRIFSMNIDSMKQTVGAAFLPMVNNMFTSLNPLIQNAIPKVSEGVKKIADTIVSHKGEIIDTLKTVAGAAKELFGFISEHGEAVKATLIGIGAAFATFKTIGTVMSVFKTATKGIEGLQGAAKGAKIFENLFKVPPQVALIIAAIALIAGAAYLIIKNWGPIKAFFTGVWSGIKSGIEGIGISIKNTFEGAVNGIKTAWNGIKTFFATLWNDIKSVGMAIITPFVSGLTNIFNSMKLGLTNIFDGLKLYFTGVWNALKLIFLGPILLICDLVTGNFAKLSSDANKIFTGLQNAFTQIWNGIKLIFTGVVQAIVGFLQAEWNGIKNTATSIFNALNSFFTGVWNGIKNTFVSIWNGLVSFFTGLPGKFSSIASGIGTAIKSGFNSAIDFITSLPGKALGWGKDMIDGLINGIKSKINSIGSAVSGIADKIRSFLHFSTPDEGPLRDYESWMPDFVNGMAKGLTNNIGKLKNAAINAASVLSNGLKANVNIGSSGASNINNINRNTTNIKNSYGSLLHFDKLVLANDLDIETVAYKLEFYRQQYAKAVGGNS